MQAKAERGRDEITIQPIGALDAIRPQPDRLGKISLAARLHALLAAMLLHPIIRQPVE